MSQQMTVRRPKQQTEAENVQRKTAKELGQNIQKIKPQGSNQNQVKTESQGVTSKIEKQLKSREGTSNLQKNMERSKESLKQNEQPKMDWEQKYNSAKSDIKNSLKNNNADLSSQLEKVYQGMLKNCLKQNQDEPHKLQNCWEQFTSKMQPIYIKMQEKSTQSADTLKKCFESKRNAEECIKQGIKFGQQSLQDATNSLKSYLA